MDILRELQRYAQEIPERAAIRCGDVVLTYEELWKYSDALAMWILHREKAKAGVKGEVLLEAKHPIAVYGHKNPWMLVCFLACVKAGHAYCPIDWSVPEARTERILRSLPSEIVFATETLHADVGEKQVIKLLQMQQLAGDGRNGTPEEYGTEALKECKAETNWVRGSETWYIIFTSGSTGMPKGVQISADCLNHYLDWSVGLGSSREEKRGQVFLNQAPFSFDLSVMDLYTCLASGGTLYCLEKSVQSDYRCLMESLEESGANVWVSTPSFAEVCLSEHSFAEEKLPGLTVFLFCGETLGNRTVRKLQERFPKARIVNTYGPTESTVAVTDVLVTPELAEGIEPLPVGRAKPGTRIEIWDENGCVLPDGEKGEVIILGDTVSTGYYGQEDLTARAFFTDAKTGERGYRTGDKGYLEQGMLFYCGRIDLQIKLHGYRIELEDIENNIRHLSGVEHVAVLPNVRDGKVKSLTAYVVEGEVPQDARAESARLKQDLLQYVPDYMVPKKFVFLEQMPMTDNGKADRKRLGGTGL